MLDGVAPHVKVDQYDAEIKLAFKEGARPSSQWMKRPAVDSHRVIQFCMQLRDPRGYLPHLWTWGTWDERRETESLEKSIEKVAPLGAICKGLRDTSGKNLTLQGHLLVWKGS